MPSSTKLAATATRTAAATTSTPPATTKTLYEQFCRPRLGELLRLVGLDVEYVRAEGDELFTKDGRRVFDFLGGFGSTVLGHNPSAIRDEVSLLMSQRVPVHSQISARVGAGNLAETLSELLVESCGSVAAAVDRPSFCTPPPPPVRFVSTFVSSGSEAVEGAIKHALMSWGTKRDRLLERIEQARCLLMQEAENDTCGGGVDVGGSVGGGGRRRDALLAALHDASRRLREATPALLALKNSYHGRTAAALAVTANASYGDMFPRTAVDVRFIARDSLDEDVERALDELRMEGLALPPAPSSSVPAQPPSLSSFSRIALCIVEWVQGEGGIFPVPERTARALSSALKREGVPLCADEIQSGLFRTGTLLASEHYSKNAAAAPAAVVPDYVLLGKGLGGGNAKIASISIRNECYESEFGRVHGSTFADDDLSCAVALKVLGFLCGNPERKRELRARADAFESTVRSAVARIAGRYPGVIRDFRGKGFMLGVELDVDLGGTAPTLLDAFNQTGLTVYALCSWLLHRRGVRLAAALNIDDDDEGAVRGKTTTLRIQPSVFVSVEAVSALLGAFEEMCGLLYERKLAELLAPVLRQDRLTTSAPATTVSTLATTTSTMATFNGFDHVDGSTCALAAVAHVASASAGGGVPSLSSSSSSAPPPSSLLSSVVSPPRLAPLARTPSMLKAVFLSHLIDERHVAALDPALEAFMSPSRRREFFEKASPLAGSSVYHEQIVTIGGEEGINGPKRQILLQCRGIFATSDFFEKSLRAGDGAAARKVFETACVAASEGADVIGLGQFTSIVTLNGVTLLPRADKRNKELVVVGCDSGGAPLDQPSRATKKAVMLTTGNSLTVAISYRALLRVVSARGNNLRDLRVAVIGAAGNIGRIYAELLAPDVASLLLVHREPLDASPKFRNAYRRVSAVVGPAATSTKIEATHLLEHIADCDVVINGTNSTQKFLEPRLLKRNAVILDVSVPSNINKKVLSSRPDVECFVGANATLPLGQKLISPLMPTEDGDVFACMAETAALAMAMALDGAASDQRGGAPLPLTPSDSLRRSRRGGSHSLGALSREGVLATLAIADRVGIGIGHVKRMTQAEAAVAQQQKAAAAAAAAAGAMPGSSRL